MFLLLAEKWQITRYFFQPHITLSSLTSANTSPCCVELQPLVAAARIARFLLGSSRNGSIGGVGRTFLRVGKKAKGENLANNYEEEAMKQGSAAPDVLLFLLAVSCLLLPACVAPGAPGVSSFRACRL